MPDLFENTPTYPDTPCHCGGTKFRLLAGVGPHAAGLRCDNCGAFKRWVSKSEYAKWTTPNAPA